MYVDYALRVLKKIATYEDLIAYSAYYDGVMDEAQLFLGRNYPADMIIGAENISQLFRQELKSEKLNGSVILGNYRFNAIYLTSHQYKDLVLRRSDIRQAAVSTDFRAGNKHSNSGLDFITCMLISENNMVPCCPTLVMIKSGLFDIMKTKAKQSAMNILMSLYPNIMVEDAKQLRKQLRSGGAICHMDSKLMDDLLSAVHTNTGCCKGESMINDHAKYLRHAAHQDQNIGFCVSKNDL